jgi:hypothetical protein
MDVAKNTHTIDLINGRIAKFLIVCILVRLGKKFFIIRVKIFLWNK